MMKKHKAFALAALMVAVALPVNAATNSSNKEADKGKCGVDRVCLTKDTEAAISDQIEYASRQKKLKRILAIESLRADIAKQQSKAAEAQKSMARPARPAPQPVASSDTDNKSDVNTDFPAFGGASNGSFPFPDGVGSGSAAGPKVTAPFEVAGTSKNHAVVRVYGEPRVVSIGDKLPMGQVDKINFNEVVLGNGKGKKRRYSVAW